MEWFTSDTHFGHHNIIKFTDRQKFFQTVEEMNDLLVSNWNSVVKPEDTIWHLGDVYFKNYERLEELNGTKKLILGNHDWKNIKSLEKYFDIYGDSIRVDRNNELIMCHYPIIDWPHKFHGWLHLHGHSHGRINFHSNAIDVGVDSWDLKPTSLEQIKQRCWENTVKNPGFDK